MDCNADALMQSARCFRRIPPSALSQVITYLLCKVVSIPGYNFFIRSNELGPSIFFNDALDYNTSGYIEFSGASCNVLVYNPNTDTFDFVMSIPYTYQNGIIHLRAPLLTGWTTLGEVDANGDQWHGSIPSGTIFVDATKFPITVSAGGYQ